MTKHSLALVPYYIFTHMRVIHASNNRDAAIYALGVGACGRDAVDADELKYVYHENGQRFIQVLNQITIPGIESNYYSKPEL